MADLKNTEDTNRRSDTTSMPLLNSDGKVVAYVNAITREFSGSDDIVSDFNDFIIKADSGFTVVAYDKSKATKRDAFADLRAKRAAKERAKREKEKAKAAKSA